MIFSLKQHYWRCFFFVLLVCCSKAQSQYLYSKSDAAAINKYRKTGVAAFQNYDRAALYKVGLFFETLYKKYKDTSITAAIAYYKASVLSEGELYDPSEKAAFQLGQIYETGIGTTVDYNKAAIYYLISGSYGSKQLEKIRDELCPADTILYSPQQWSTQGDSIVIRFHPFCQWKSSSARMVLEKLANYMKANPQASITFSIADPEEFVTSYYSYWKRTRAFEGIVKQVSEYLADHGVDRGSVSPFYVQSSQSAAPGIALTIHVATKPIDN